MGISDTVDASTVMEEATRAGADLVGIADLTPVRDKLGDAGFAVARDYSRAVCIGITLLAPVVDRLLTEEGVAAKHLYRQFCYDMVNERLDTIALALARLLSFADPGVLPVPSRGSIPVTSKLTGLFSHKAAARLAGLGWIGKSCLLVTPSYGPRVRWATVLTNAPLQANQRLIEDGCRSCRVCVDACPAGAFTGKSFRDDEGRQERMDANLCNEHMSAMEQAHGVRVCGICLAMCPYGRRTSTNANPVGC